MKTTNAIFRLLVQGQYHEKCLVLKKTNKTRVHWGHKSSILFSFSDIPTFSMIHTLYYLENFKFDENDERNHTFDPLCINIVDPLEVESYFPGP